MMKFPIMLRSELSETGVKHVFLLAGGGSMHLVDSVGQAS